MIREAHLSFQWKWAVIEHWFKNKNQLQHACNNLTGIVLNNDYLIYT